VRRYNGQSYDEYLKGLAQATGIERPHTGRTDVAGSEAKEEGIQRRMEESRRSGRTHLAHKAEHAADLSIGALLAIMLEPANEGIRQQCTRHWPERNRQPARFSLWEWKSWSPIRVITAVRY
jgi:hypothetical protein